MSRSSPSSDVETRLLVNCWDSPLGELLKHASCAAGDVTTDRLTLIVSPTTDDNRQSDRKPSISPTDDLFDNQQSQGKQQKQRKPLNKCSHNRDIQMSKSDTIWLSNEVCLFTKFWTFLFWKKLMIDSDATDKSEIAQKALVVLVINVKIWGPHISQPREQTPEVV